jgi:hypothetical protein
MRRSGSRYNAWQGFLKKKWQKKATKKVSNKGK